jgi:hypothetical protein
MNVLPVELNSAILILPLFALCESTNGGDAILFMEKNMMCAFKGHYLYGAISAENLFLWTALVGK